MKQKRIRYNDTCALKPIEEDVGWKMNEIIKKYTRDWKDMLYIIAGSLLLAYAFQAFLLPNNIISGGVSSLSIVINELSGWDPAYIQYAINIPLLLMSYFLLGKDVFFKSALGSLLFPFFIDIIGEVTPITNNLLLATVYGGVLTGIGIGLVYKAKSSTGGTSIVAQILEKYTRFSMGESTLISDGVIILIGFFVFDIEAIMYGIIALVFISHFIDLVLVGNRSQKTVLIISDSPNEIRQEIIENFDRGVTRLDIRGGYQNDQKEMLMVVIQDHEITALQEMILQLDEDAFVVVMSASEVMGRGFSLEKYFPTNQRQ